MVNLSFSLLCFVFAALVTVNARSIRQDLSANEALKYVGNENRQLIDTIASYRHRFEHSPNFKALRWSSAQQAAPPYCDLCYALVPVVWSTDTLFLNELITDFICR